MGGGVAGPRVTTILLNWNQWERTIHTLDALRQTDHPFHQVLVIDNGSEDGSFENLESYARNSNGATGSFRLVRLEQNLGYSGGMNAAVELLKPDMPDFLFLLNNDARPEVDAISRCVLVSQETDAAIVGPVIRDAVTGAPVFAGGSLPHEFFFSRRAVPRHGASWWEVSWAEGSAMLIRKDLALERLRERGHFLDPSLFMYCEDLELCHWAGTRGFRVVVAGETAVHHAVGGSSGGRENPLMYYYVTRNKVLVARRALPPLLRLLFHLWFPLSRLVRALQRRLQGRAETARAIVSGLWDGYRGVTGKWRLHPTGR